MKTTVFQLLHQPVGYPNRWETINKLKKLLERRSQTGLQLHVKEFEKRRTRIEMKNRGYSLASFDNFESDILSDFRRLKKGSQRHGL